LRIVGIIQQSKLHAARLASCRFTIGAIKFSVLSRELVVDTYAGERPSQFSPPFSPFELVHCCIERYLCVARVHSPSQEGGVSGGDENARVLRSILLYTAGKVSGSLHTPLCLAQTGVWAASRPPDPLVWISARYSDGSLALAWIFERSGHVYSHRMKITNNHFKCIAN